MEAIIIYCHGYNSSAKTDKVDVLRNAGFNVFAWDINVDPDVSLPELEQHIDDVLMDHLNRQVKLIFVGTSLGAWYASNLAKSYGSCSVLVNPAIDPAKALPKIGADVTITNKYEPLLFDESDNIIVASDDELLDPVDTLVASANSNEVLISPTGGHRFNGPEFQLVIDMIKRLTV